MGHKEKMIIEEVPLSQCVKGDDLDICYDSHVKWSTIGYITLLRIKPLKNGEFQIKYRKQWKDATVQKATVPGTVMAKRMRKIVAEDGPDAGRITNEVLKRKDPVIVNDEITNVTPEDFAAMAERIKGEIQIPIPNLVNCEFDQEMLLGRLVFEHGRLIESLSDSLRPQKFPTRMGDLTPLSVRALISKA